MGLNDLTRQLYEQRIGEWTVIEYLPDRVEIRRSKAHLRGVIAAFVLAGLVGGSLPAVLGHRSFGIAVFVGFVFLALLAAIWRSVRSHPGRRFKSLVLAVHDQSPPGEPDDPSRHCLASEILALELRENHGRYSDDTHLMQLWLRLRSRNHPVLIHQNYYLSRRRVVATARRLASRWGCEVRSGEEAQRGQYPPVGAQDDRSNTGSGGSENER